MKLRILPLFLALLMLLGCTPRPKTLSIPDHTNRVPLSEQADVASTPAPTQITEVDAMEIALNHAQYTHDQVRYMDTSYEIDDGIPQYEVEFRIGRTEFEYEIHAETGEVLSFEVHR